MKITQYQKGSDWPEFASFAAHPLQDGTPRRAEMYICTPSAGITADTGMLLVNHNWGGTWEMCSAWCPILADAFDVITIDVNYYQSGWRAGNGAYDSGVIQTMDCLRALYEVRQYAAENHILYDPRRTFACGASGGGNVSLMLNKFAPHTFACIIDLCGMVFTEDIAFGTGTLYAEYSRDPASPAYLAPEMLDIRNLANPEHLAFQYRCNPENKIIIVHGAEDGSCPCPDKVRVLEALLRAGFQPEFHLITRATSDGKIFTAPDHQLGDRPAIIVQVGKEFIAPDEKFAKRLNSDDDFIRKSRIVYPVSGGNYTIDYSKGSPEISSTSGRL